MYDIGEEDIEIVTDQPTLSVVAKPSMINMQLPVIELMKVLTSIFRPLVWLFNIYAIILFVGLISL